MSRNFRLLPVLLGIILTLSCLFSDNAIALMVKSDEIIPLKQRKVIQISLTSSLRKGLNGSESKILINAPAKKVWDVLDEKENLPKFIYQIKKAEILEENNEKQKVAASVKICRFLPLFKYILVFDRTEKYRRMKFKKTGGAFKELFGYFEVIPYEGKTILAYRIYSDPGFYIPDFICDSVCNDATEMMKAIRTEAEK